MLHPCYHSNLGTCYGTLPPMPPGLVHLPQADLGRDESKGYPTLTSYHRVRDALLCLFHPCLLAWYISHKLILGQMNLKTSLCISPVIGIHRKPTTMLPLGICILTLGLYHSLTLSVVHFPQANLGLDTPLGFPHPW